RGLAALWLSVLGAGLVAAAAQVVGIAGRDQLGAAGRAVGLTAVTLATLYSSQRLRSHTPVVARVVLHLGLVVGAVTFGAFTGAIGGRWPAIIGVAGGAALPASMWWTLGGSHGRAALRALGAGAALAGLAALTPLPLGVGVAAAGLALMVASRWCPRWSADLEQVAFVLAVAGPIPAGGVPVAYRVGPGTLADLGLRGHVIDWAGPVAGLLGAVALLIWAGRHRSRPAAAIAFIGFAVNGLIGLADSDWSSWVPVTSFATAFLALQLAGRATQRHPFWADVLTPMAWAGRLIGLSLFGPWMVPLVVDVAAHGQRPELAIAPVLLAAGYAVIERRGADVLSMRPVGWLFLGTAVYLSTASVTAAAAVAGAMAVAAAWQRRSVEAIAAASLAWGLGLLAQLVEDPLIAAIPGWVAVLSAVAVLSKRPPLAAIVPLQLAAAVTGIAALAGTTHFSQDVTGLAAASAIGLVAVSWRHVRSLMAAAVPGGFAAVANLQLIAVLDDRVDAGAAIIVAVAGVLVSAIGFAAWVAHRERGADHLVIVGAVVAAAFGVVAAGVDPVWLVALALISGVAAAGISFVRPVYGLGDTAALAALAVASNVGLFGEHETLGWMALLALGVVVGLHGLCLLDWDVARAGGAVAGVSAIRLAVMIPADERITAITEHVGINRTDLTVIGLTALLACAGAVTTRIRPATRSWMTWGPAAGLAGLYLVATIAIADDPASRTLVALTVGGALAAAGAWRRLVAPLLIGTATIVGAVGLVSWQTIRAMPVWAWMAAGGALLIVVAVLLERRSSADEPLTVPRLLSTYR
ncbi:MAG: SCO7613 C-terminal domain-containing membrane protein, partial [Acidimicrobiales bacterium]